MQEVIFEWQLLLLERIIHRLDSQEFEQEFSIETQMQSMAADPEIQMELRRIDNDFLHTDMDGLGKLY